MEFSPEEINIMNKITVQDALSRLATAEESQRAQEYEDFRRNFFKDYDKFIEIIAKLGFSSVSRSEIYVVYTKRTVPHEVLKKCQVLVQEVLSNIGYGCTKILVSLKASENLDRGVHFIEITLSKWFN